MNRTARITLALLLIIVAVGGISYLLVHSTASTQSNSSANSGKLQVIAGENFWGSIASQIGGNDVQVTSIVSDPNADPHEYESNTTDDRSFASAQLVILNGAGYDSWGDKLISGSPNPNRLVLNVADLLGKKEGDNPHFWYNPTYVNEVAEQIEKDMIAQDPVHDADYQKNYEAFEASAADYQNRIASIKQQYAGTKVAATEDIFQYLATASGLDLISPPAFTQAVAEGNDPPADSIVTFQEQLKSGQVKVLVYNQQTVTPLTESMKKLAADEGIPVIGITETIQPPDTTFQVWMNAELINLQNALNAQTLGQ
jgi:zinc/manganese transport system substrate-binding protein